MIFFYLAGYVLTSQIWRYCASRLIHDLAEINDAEGIHWAVSGGVELDSLNEDDQAALHVAAKHGASDTAQTLISAGADINLKTKTFKKTPLHTAVMADQEDLVALLLGAGANPNVRAINGQTPLHTAAFEGKLKIVRLLVESGARVEPQGGLLQTPLHSAVAGGNIHVVEFLLLKGADVNAKAEDGTTPLHWAIGAPNGVEIAKFLVESGANVNARDRSGKTPRDSNIESHLMDLYTQEQQTPMTLFLRRHGAVTGEELDRVQKNTHSEQ